MTINAESAQKVFRELGYAVTHRTKKISEYSHPAIFGLTLYLQRDVGNSHFVQVVLSPDTRLDSIHVSDGFTVGTRWLHHSNFRNFPKRRHRGQLPIHYGRPVRVHRLEALRAVLDSLAAQ